MCLPSLFACGQLPLHPAHPSPWSPPPICMQAAATASPRVPPSSWEDIKNLTPSGAKLLADKNVHLDTAWRFVKEVYVSHCMPLPTNVLPCLPVHYRLPLHHQFAGCLTVATPRTDSPIFVLPTVNTFHQIGFSSPEDLSDITEEEVRRAEGRVVGSSNSR